MPVSNRSLRRGALGLATLSLAAVLTSCGGGGGSPAPASGAGATFTVGGAVSGLTGTGLILRNNGNGDDRLVSSSGAFSFNIPVANGAAYAVAVQSQPSNQTCTVANGTGVVSSGNVTSVVVTCVPITFALGGNVSGLTASGLVLRNSGADDLAVLANGSFIFAAQVNSGSTYSVTVGTQPNGQNCTVTNGSGTITANVANVVVTCAVVTYTLSGTVTGIVGSGYTIQNNASEELVLNANGSFAFTTPFTSGQTYNVLQVLPPANPIQACTITNGAGTVTNANVSNIAIACETHKTRFAFNANPTDGTVQTFAIDDNSGHWSPRTIVKTGSNPAGVVGERSRRSLYVVNRGSANVTGLDIEANTAVLTEKPTSPYPIGLNSTGTFAHTSGNFFYYSSQLADSNNLTGYAIDAATGQLNSVPGSPYANTGPISMVNDPGGRFIYELLESGEIKIDSVNVTTGQLTEVGRTQVPGGPRSLLMYKSGRYLYAVSGSNGIYGYSVHPTTGLLTLMPSFPYTGVANAASNGFHVSGRYFYMRDSLVNAMHLLIVNPSTGALSLAPNSPYHTGVLLGSTVTHPSGRFQYGFSSANGIYAYSINTDTGAATSILGSPFAATGAVIGYIDPTGKYLYVSASTQNRMLAFLINQSTGALMPLPGQPAMNIGRSSIGWLVSAFTNGLSFLSDFAYAPNAIDNTVSGFSIDNATGLMTSLGSFATGGSAPVSVAMDMRGRFLYSLNSQSNNISAFTVGNTGALTQVSGSPFGAGTRPTSLVVDPSGRFAYVTNAGDSEIRAFQINDATGALTSPTSYSLTATSNPLSLAMHPNGLFLYAVVNGFSGIQGYTINQTSGILTNIGGLTSTLATLPTAMIIDPSGRFAYVLSGNSGLLAQYSISALTGALTPLSSPTVTVGSTPEGLAIDRSSRFLYVGDGTTNQISVYAINPTSGLLTAIPGSPFATAAPATALKVDYSGKYLHVSNRSTNQAQSYSIQFGTGALTAIPNSTVNTGQSPRDLVINTRTQ